MSKKDDLLNNNEDQKDELKVKKTRTRKKKVDEKILVTETNDLNSSNLSLEPNLKNNDEIINIELYDGILSTLFNSLSNPIIRNEIKVNQDILKYMELQISNLFFLETVLSEQLKTKAMAKEFLQLTADITNLALSISKSPKKSAIEILEDRNLLIVTIINSCKGVERESLEKIRVVDFDALSNLNNQIAALSNFTEEKVVTLNQDVNLNQDDNSNQINKQNPNFNNNPTNNSNINLNANMANLTKLGLLPQHPAANPNFYPFVSKPLIIPKLRKILSGMLICLNVLLVVSFVISLFVKGNLEIFENKPQVFSLNKVNGWFVLALSVILYSSFIYVFLKPTKIVREKYHTSYFMLGLLFFWLAITIAYFIWQTTDKYYADFFASIKPDEGDKLNPKVVEDLKNLPNFQVFKIFIITTAAICILPLVLVLVLILLNPKLDRNKVIRANTEYQNAISAALSGQKYEIDPTLFESDEPSDSDEKSNKANFSGRF